MGAAEHYRGRRDAARVEAEAEGRRSRAYSTARVVVFLVAAGGLVRALLGDPRGWPVAGLAVVLFVGLAVLHERVIDRESYARRVMAWADQGLGRLEGRYEHVTAGVPEVPDTHPYAGDLDVVGARSLLASLDTTRTAPARALLSGWLLSPSPVAEVRERQARAKELSERTDLREALWAEGARLAKEPPSIEPLLAWIEGGSARMPEGLGLRVVALALPAATVGLLFFGGRLAALPRALWVVPLLLQLGLMARHQKAIRAAIDAVSEHHLDLARYARMFAVVERGGLLADGPSGPTSAAIARLSRIASFVDARRNEVFRLFIGPLLAWDLSCALACEAFRRTAGADLRARLGELARLEALAALGTRAFERPGDVFPEIVPGGTPVLVAEGLTHPLLPADRAVRNAVSLEGSGTLLLVTGSNMSGKSTLLRALGANVVLALAGAPVRATRLSTAAFDVRTSMRIRDSLDDGVSHFFAELRRLKAVVDAADAATADEGRPPVLFLLDEILHGTNSRERHIGARAIVHHLVGCRGAGAVSTHDLDLARLEGEAEGHVRNVHFREQVDGDTMTFDYVLRDGPVTSSNALRLMRMVGLTVEEREER